MTNAIGTQAIGPTFTNELQSAGLVLPILGFSWGNYGLDPLPASLTASEVATIQQVYQAHDPTKQPMPPADWTNFLKWIAATFDAPTVNRFASGYSEFFGYCQFGNTAGAQWCLTNGKVKLSPDGQPVLSATNYALFQQANVTYNLGMVLP